MTNKVYWVVFKENLHGLPLTGDVVRKRTTQAALEDKETIYFHQPRGSEEGYHPVGGCGPNDPSFYIECSDRFLEHVKKLAGFEHASQETFIPTKREDVPTLTQKSIGDKISIDKGDLFEISLIEGTVMGVEWTDVQVTAGKATLLETVEHDGGNGDLDHSDSKSYVRRTYRADAKDDIEVTAKNNFGDTLKFKVHVEKLDHVYELRANLDGMSWGSTMKDFVQKRDGLGLAISALARKENETVYFHDYQGDVGGSPVVLLECSKPFLEKVKKLSELGALDAPSLPTERVASIQDHFFGPAPDMSENPGLPPGGCIPPSPSKKPKGPRP